MNCLICACESTKLFDSLVLYKYSVRYYKCTNCGFIQTEKPYWLNEAYEKAITATDIGLVGRNIDLSYVVYDLIINAFDETKQFLDYGGGYGLLVRLLRDKGLNFYRQDIYCENLFALNHDIEDLENSKQNFELTTCFEVFEHTPEPNQLLETLKGYSNSILISTLLVPDGKYDQAADWWYFSPETGQHVSFYTLHSLQLLADKHGLILYSDNVSLHLFTIKKLKTDPFADKKSLKDRFVAKIRYILRRRQKTLPSLIGQDVITAKNKALKSHRF